MTLDEARGKHPFLLLPIRLLKRFEVNRAVLFSIMNQGWSLLTGPLTILVIAQWLSSDEQGFYYTFNSVLGLQIFVELGLATVLVQVASHEWVLLHRNPDGSIGGDPDALSRLSSLLRFALKWYVAAGGLVIVGLSIGGYFFFTDKPHPDIVWQVPWFCLCVIAGINLMMSPLFSVIEGTNQVASIFAFRFVLGVANTAGLILGIQHGFGLYALPLAALTRLLCNMIFISWKHRRFVLQLTTCKLGRMISWQKEVWPFQWRLSLSWLSGYFIFQLFTPVMFHYHGPKVAGQMGMTMSLMTTLGTLSYAWLAVRAPQFGMLIAKKDYVELDQLFHRLVWITMGIVAAGAVAILGFVLILHWGHFAMGSRMLTLLPVCLLLGQQIINCAINAMAIYLRAHKKEPLMIVSLVSALLIGLSTWQLGATYGPTGAAAGYFVICLVWGLPSCWYIFQRCRTQWHQPGATLSPETPVAAVT